MKNEKNNVRNFVIGIVSKFTKDPVKAEEIVNQILAKFGSIVKKAARGSLIAIMIVNMVVMVACSTPYQHEDATTTADPNAFVTGDPNDVAGTSTPDASGGVQQEPEDTTDSATTGNPSNPVTSIDQQLIDAMQKIGNIHAKKANYIKYEIVSVDISSISVSGDSVTIKFVANTVNGNKTQIMTINGPNFAIVITDLIGNKANQNEFIEALIEYLEYNDSRLAKLYGDVIDIKNGVITSVTTTPGTTGQQTPVQNPLPTATEQQAIDAVVKFIQECQKQNNVISDKYIIQTGEFDNVNTAISLDGNGNAVITIIGTNGNDKEGVYTVTISNLTTTQKAMIAEARANNATTINQFCGVIADVVGGANVNNATVTASKKPATTTTTTGTTSGTTTNP